MPEVCVIYNPTAGKRRAERRLEPVRRAWGDRASFRPTLHAGHAAELARQAALDGFAIVAAAGGDGTVHEVATGLLTANRPDVKFAVIPIGSANDFAFSLKKLPGDIARIDVGRARRDDGLTKTFICNLGMGFNGTVTVESRRIHWLQGSLLYGLAALRALTNQFEHPTFEIRIDDEPAWTTPTLLFAVLLGEREGGFVLAPAAKLDDGWFDFVHAADLSRFQVVRLLPRLALWGAPKEWPGVRQGRCRRIAIRSDRPVNVHVDGEFLCYREDGMKNFEIDIEPAALAVDAAFTRRGGMPH